MPKLENPKHEEFALHLARGMKQGNAYIMAGYTENKGAASRLANSPPIMARVEELKLEIAQRVHTAMTVVSEENWQSLADMGLTMEWVALQYKEIYEAAMKMGQLPAANTAVANIQKLIELERNARPDDDKQQESKINVSDMLKVLDKFGDIVKNAPALPQDDLGETARVVSFSDLAKELDE